DSYSLFLIPDARWRDAEYQQPMAAIWKTFDAFGRSIGDRRVAIWFLDLDGKLDIDRSKFYCDRFGLGYNDGPYVVTTKKRPDLLQPKDEIVVIKLGGISAARIPSVLQVLEQDLRTNRDIRRGTLVYEEVKQRMLTLSEKYPDALQDVLSFV